MTFQEIKFGELAAEHLGRTVTITVLHGESATGVLKCIEHDGQFESVDAFGMPRIRETVSRFTKVTVGPFGEHTFHSDERLGIKDVEEKK